MIGSDESVETILAMCRDAKEYAELRMERFEMDMSFRLSRFASFLVTVVAGVVIL